MRPIAAYVTISLCWSVEHKGELCKNGRTDPGIRLDPYLHKKGHLEVRYVVPVLAPVVYDRTQPIGVAEASRYNYAAYCQIALETCYVLCTRLQLIHCSFRDRL